ncbi:lytic transglycosylase domain-containing protein [Mesorhizobium sp. M5C.F.Cr.IN.023.01.1.1]|uniref:lytic transglycosylase domain-containing protein n=1 Tax=Mesorhizobium sp. M5C.F.Cr.IN.023.01.1.1 TaxID=2496768 RepID=UPI000FCB6E43|nr:lytic transglycosylase domain-containing protein [Mesorhizobium sp. M5C.F.Cr.IN.023.01.1.1]RUV70514.1 lytic transglycosylase domain-containing protein [Mesorhizobium sp. M5C.F.Cr.IN.023.01.1.1]
MVKRARIAGIPRKAALIGAAALTVVAGGTSHAQEGRNNTNFVGTQGTSAPLRETALTAIFENRWPNSKGDFVLGADGVVTSGTASQSKPRQDSLIGAVAHSFAFEEHMRNGTNMDKLATGAITHIGVMRPVDDYTVDVQECGPPPLSATEIKSLVVETARRHKVDEVFATAIAWAESGFDRFRNSNKGARGPMQLMPAAAERFGVRDVCDPAQNIEGGMKYLRVLLNEFQNPLLVAAAYNSGEQRIYEHGGIPPFKETVGYVAKVVNYQLGLPMPAAKGKTRAAAAEPVADAGDTGDVGVIAVKKTGKFVGGVMHF